MLLPIFPASGWATTDPGPASNRYPLSLPSHSSLCQDFDPIRRISQTCLSLSFSFSFSLCLPHSWRPFVFRWTTFVRYLLSSLSLSQSSTPLSFILSFKAPLYFLRGDEAESERLCEWIQRKESGDETFAAGRGRDETERRRGREKDGREKTRPRNKQASHQCAVGGTRFWKHVVFFFRLFSPLFHARFSLRIFSFCSSSIPVAYLSSRSFQNPHPSHLLFFFFFSFEANALSKNLERPMHVLGPSVFRSPTGTNAKNKIYVSSRSMISAHERSGRVSIALKSRIETIHFFSFFFLSFVLLSVTILSLFVCWLVFRMKLSSQRWSSQWTSHRNMIHNYIEI